ncbi:unnamed protein product [Rangifer tarandus platyrhynchus]|uniref:Uncharacterized protein n=2 Tax=Rangifer tarandus platyrhynchus TaxID=3082113 RepID=A0ABN8ZUL3_RANTA|nr:unnamed protein product [Rangifer tarandus platyrhynchus]CAI9711799.1 unnamed protein product [Rangifer tarandus platyrhynchus]
MIGGRRVLGNLFPGPGEEIALEPSCPSEENEFAFLFFIWLPRARGGHQPTPPANALPPRFPPLSRVGTRVRPAPKLLFRIPISLQSTLYPSLRRRRKRRGPGPGSPFQFDPARVLAPSVSLAGATWWTRSAVLGRELRSAKSRRDPPSRNDSRSAHRYLLPSLCGGTELPEEPLEPGRKEV